MSLRSEGKATSNRAANVLNFVSTFGNFIASTIVREQMINSQIAQQQQAQAEKLQSLQSKIQEERQAEIKTLSNTQQKASENAVNASKKK